MSAPKPGQVSGSRPVNQRTASRQPLPPAPVPAAVLARLASAQARRRLGPPVSEQLLAHGTQHARARPRALAVVGSLVAAAGGTALFLAWLQAAAVLGLAGGAGLCTGLLLARRGLRPASAPHATVQTPLFDPEALLALDRMLEAVAPELPDDLALQLAALKQLLVRMALQQAGAGVHENFTLEDRLYVTECVRRYLPDSLQSYLAIPRSQRSATVLEAGQSASALLASQLGLLQAELEKREARLVRSAGEPLLRQDRFLRSKTGP